MTEIAHRPEALPIETERLILRRFQHRDVRHIVEFSREADFWLARSLDWRPTSASVRAYFEAQRDLQPETLFGWMNLIEARGPLSPESQGTGRMGRRIRICAPH